MSTRLLILALLIALWPGCSCAENGHIEPVPITATLGDTAVHCNCNLTFNYPQCTGGTCEAHFGLKMCLPARLNAALVDPKSAEGAALMRMTPAQFRTAVDDYCQQDVSRIAYHLIKVFNGSWCDYKAPWAPSGGIGESIRCFAQPLEGAAAQATERETTTCDKPCPTTVCDYNSNCGEKVQDALGGIHIEECRCNQVTIHGCPGDPAESLPTPVFCRP